jgi:hypothetical protein
LRDDFHGGVATQCLSRSGEPAFQRESEGFFLKRLGGRRTPQGLAKVFMMLGKIQKIQLGMPDGFFFQQKRGVNRHLYKGHVRAKKPQHRIIAIITQALPRSNLDRP